MTYQITPSPEDFNPKKPQLVYARIINDLDTPVSAYLKIAENKILYPQHDARKVE